MHTFFHGWRRKAGVVTLVVALAFVGLWVRSHVVSDAIEFPLLGRQHTIITVLGTIYWGATDIDPENGRWWYNSNNELVSSGLVATDQMFETARHDFGAIPQLRYRDLMIRHWSIAIPLTLLSAYLLLIPSLKRPPIGSQPDA